MTNSRPLSFLLAATLASSGCFSYVEVAPAAVPLGNEVRVELTRVGFAALPEIPTYPGPDLDGTLISADATAMKLSVPVAIHRDGMLMQTVEQQVTIPTSSIVQVERRMVDRKKTAFMVGAGAATLVGIFLGFKAGNNHTPDVQPGDPGEPELRVPLIHVAFPGLR